MDITALLNREVPCPYGCRNMVLKTKADHERGYCEFCSLTRFRCETAPPDRIWGNPQGRWVQENADHDPEDHTLYWEPRDDD